MELTMLKGKIHRATVTQAELDYVGEHYYRYRSIECIWNTRI